MDMRKNYQRYQRPYRMQNPYGCGYQTTERNDNTGDCLRYYTLAMVYVPEQKFDLIYDLSDAMKHGTIFKELNMPFTGCRNGRHR